jgi:hypothetical protein
MGFIFSTSTYLFADVALVRNAVLHNVTIGETPVPTNSFLLLDSGFLLLSDGTSKLILG